MVHPTQNASFENPLNTFKKRVNENRNAQHNRNNAQPFRPTGIRYQFLDDYRKLTPKLTSSKEPDADDEYTPYTSGETRTVATYTSQSNNNENTNIEFRHLFIFNLWDSGLRSTSLRAGFWLSLKVSFLLETLNCNLSP